MTVDGTIAYMTDPRSEAARGTSGFNRRKCS
jgi:hypothetical protein